MSDAHAATSEPLARAWTGSVWVRYLEAPLAVNPTIATTAGALGVGVAFDVAVHAGVIGAAGAACILLASVVLLTSGRVRNPHGQALIAAAPFFGVWLMFRTSDWLVPFDILAAAGLLGFGASLSRTGSGLDMTIPEVFARAARGCLQAFAAPAFLMRGIPRGRPGRASAVARGLAIVAPIVIVLGALLASADAVFASFFDFEDSKVVQHVLLVAVGTIGAGAILRLASAEGSSTPGVDGPRIGAVEATVVLASVTALLGTFAAARLIALSQGGRRVLSSAGLTYAEYARTGFFQLLAAAIIVVALLLALRATTALDTASQRRTFVGLSLAVVALTLAVCVSAFHRLVLYEAAFGLTMLRLYVQTTIVWVALVLILLGVIVALPRSDRAWLAPAAAIAALTMLFAMNVFNPEAFVARHNLSHQPSADAFDADYLSGLSDDAVPEIARSGAAASVCTGVGEPTSWASFNVARERAADARSKVC